MTPNERYFLIGCFVIIVALVIYGLYKHMCKTIDNALFPFCCTGYPLVIPPDITLAKKEVWYPWNSGPRPEFCEDVTSILYADGRISTHWGNIAWRNSWTWYIAKDERIIAYSKGEYKTCELK